MSKPRAFLSYVRKDNKYENVSAFAERLGEEIRLQTGEEFPIFQDWKDIGWGKNWRKCIAESLDEAVFFIPILTPAYFKSGPCRDELTLFLEREKKLERDDLILAVYYVDCPLLNEEAKRAKDQLAEVIASRNYVDWRELRSEPYTSPQVWKLLAKMGRQVRDALDSLALVEPPAAPPPAAEASAAAAHPINVTAEASSNFESLRELAGTIAGEVGPVERGPSTKYEPNIRVVDPNQRGKFSTISAAILKADPGDRILVRPGTYKEGLVVDKPLEIIGEGEPGEVKIEATGENALLFQTTMGRVVNLTLRQKSGGALYGVDIAQGRLEMEDCDISSESLSCVAIHGGADPRLRRNRIHDGKSGGVFVYANGLGTLEDNDIFENILVGVAIKTGGNPTLRRNRIHDGKSGGVLVTENGLGTLEENDIFGNALSGVQIGTGSNPTLRRNRLHENKGSGIFVHQNGEGIVEDNEFFGHDYAGLTIASGANPIVRRNRIHDGKSSGVLVDENGLGTLEENDIFGNASAGVEIKTGGNPTLRRNRINKNAYEAVWVYEGGGGVFEENDLRENARGAWDIAKGCEGNVKREGNIE